MKDNIKKQLIQLVVVISSGICAYFFPIASKFLNIQSDKILIGFDIAIFNTCISILLAVIQDFFMKKMMNVTVSVKSGSQESNKLYISNDDVDEEKTIDVVVNIDVSGKKRFCKKNIMIKCPTSYILQLEKRKNVSFIKEITTSEEYEIDLNEMLSKSPEFDISFSREIHFSLLLEEHNRGNKDELRFEREKNWGLISINSNGLKLIQK
ncbi:hypothetical protein HRG38_11740 [Enterococcus faecalis]|nr:hypothetical protein [Enterococcus faecalis]